MTLFFEKVDLTGFSIENIDITYLEDIAKELPKNGVVDLNIAEKGLVLSLHAQNFCQEQILKVDKWISLKEADKNRAWAKAALDKAKKNGHTSVKNREWFASADDEFIEASNEVTLAKACKKFFENQADYYSSWHYAFKTFLKRDYDIERLGNFQANEYNYKEIPSAKPEDSRIKDDEICSGIEWK